MDRLFFPKRKDFRIRNSNNRQYVVTVSSEIDEGWLKEMLNIREIKEYFFVLHNDCENGHYHIYINFVQGVLIENVEKLFGNYDSYVMLKPDKMTVLDIANYFSRNFSLPIIAPKNYLDLICSDIEYFSGKTAKE